MIATWASFHTPFLPACLYGRPFLFLLDFPNEEMIRSMNTTAITILGWVLVPVCSALIATLVDRNKAIRRERAENARLKDERRDTLEKAIKALMRKELMNDYENYVVKKKPLDVERKREVEEIFHVYSALGGNGTGKWMYQAIAKIPPIVANHNA